MGFTAKEVFDYSIQRSEHYINLYDILHDSRRRRGRKDWKTNFRKLMHWPAAQEFYRMDGKDGNSLLIIKDQVGITPDKFQHDYVSELLRASITSGVSAMDRYFHDLIVENTVAFLGRSEKDMPKKFMQLNLPILVTKKALEKIKNNPKSRPNTLIKKELQSALRNNYTFQSPRNCELAAQILGIKDFWGKVHLHFKVQLTKEQIIEKLNAIARRRNQIVHESDIILKTSAKEISLREITHKDAKNSLSMIKKFVSAVDKIKIT
jgi:hypothetical protein